MIIEDGTIVTDADSYVSIEFADSYFSARGETSWIELDEDSKAHALVKATDFVDNIFAWNGKKASANQSLNFPRTELIDRDGYKVEGIPSKLKQAVCLASLISSSGEELFRTNESNGAVVSEKIGEIAFTYDVSKQVQDKTLYESINSLLRGFYSDKSKSRVYIGEVSRA